MAASRVKKTGDNARDADNSQMREERKENRTPRESAIESHPVASFRMSDIWLTAGVCGEKKVGLWLAYKTKNTFFCNLFQGMIDVFI